MSHLNPAMLQNLYRLQCEGTTAADYDTPRCLQETQRGLVIGNRTQCNHARQVAAGAGQAAGMRACCQQQTIITYLPPTRKLQRVLIDRDPDGAIKHEVYAQVGIKTPAAHIQRIFRNPARQVIFERGPVVGRKRCIRDNRDLCRWLFVAQCFSGGDSSNTTANYDV